MILVLELAAAAGVGKDCAIYIKFLQCMSVCLSDVRLLRFFTKTTNFSNQMLVLNIFIAKALPAPTFGKVKYYYHSVSLSTTTTTLSLDVLNLSI